MIPATPNFKLFEVSNARKEFLARWRLERRIAKELGCDGTLPNGVGEALEVSPRSYDQTVGDADIRLLPNNATSQEGRLLYVAVLFCRDNGTAVVAPFSTYATPCCKDEWLTGIQAWPLRVLQLWNALPVPTNVLAKSWKTGALSEAQLDDARELYRHAIRGTFPRAELREAVGPAISDPTDDRLVYQLEENAAMSGLRQKLFLFLEICESLSMSRLRPESSLMVEEKNEGLVFSDITQRLHDIETPLRLAASSGEMRAYILLLGDDTQYAGLDALYQDDSDSLTLEWSIDEPKGSTLDLAPGLPAFLHYRAGVEPRTIEGWTTLNGKFVTFTLESQAEKDYLRKSCTDGYARIGIVRSMML